MPRRPGRSGPVDCHERFLAVASARNPVKPEELTKRFRPDLYRSRLQVLARIELRRAGLLQLKMSASDIVQDALLQALARLPQFRGNTDPEFYGWLRAILANKLADAARHYGRKKRDAALEKSFHQCLDESARNIEELIAANQTSPSEHLLRDERARRLADALDTLLPEQRAAVEDHHLAGYSVAETAERMGRSSAAVAGLLRRGLKTLRENLEGRERGLLRE